MVMDRRAGRGRKSGELESTIYPLQTACITFDRLWEVEGPVVSGNLGKFRFDAAERESGQADGSMWWWYKLKTDRDRKLTTERHCPLSDQRLELSVSQSAVNK